MRIPPCFQDSETKKHIDNVCAQNEIDRQLLEQLCDVVQGYSGSGRKDGITADLTAKIDAFIERSKMRSL